MFYFHHGLVACVFSNCHFDKSSSHKCHIWVVSLLHEFLSYAFSNFSEGKFFGCIKAFKFFLPFMITNYMSLWIALYRKIWSQISHWNNLLESWTEAVCFDKLPFWEKLWSQMSHLNGFSASSCISEICSFIACF